MFPMDPRRGFPMDPKRQKARMVLCLFLWDQLGCGTLSGWISVLQNVGHIWNQYGVLDACTAKLTQAIWRWNRT